jgi:hypothetical protein
MDTEYPFLLCATASPGADVRILARYLLPQFLFLSPASSK